MRCRGRYSANKGKVTGNWRSVLGEELHDLCCLQNTRMTTSIMTRYVNRGICKDDWEKAYRVLVRKLKGSRTTWNAWV